MPCRIRRHTSKRRPRRRRGDYRVRPGRSRGVVVCAGSYPASPHSHVHAPHRRGFQPPTIRPLRAGRRFRRAGVPATARSRNRHLRPERDFRRSIRGVAPRQATGSPVTHNGAAPNSSQAAGRASSPAPPAGVAPIAPKKGPEKRPKKLLILTTLKRLSKFTKGDTYGPVNG